jgi:hypothetical protein
MRPLLSSPATRKLTLDGNRGNTCAAMTVTPDESPQSLTNEPAARSYSTAVHEHGAHADDELIANSHNFPHRPGGKSVQLAVAGRFETDRRCPARTDEPGPHPAISQGLPLRRRSRNGSRAAGYPGATVAHPGSAGRHAVCAGEAVTAARPQSAFRHRFLVHRRPYSAAPATTSVAHTFTVARPSRR